MHRIIIITLLLFFSSQLVANNHIKKTAEEVLNKLYKANGNHIYVKPKIKIIKSKKEAALFLRRANTIELSQKVYRICQSMGKDSLAALAFIIGHELAHAYQADFNATSSGFLAYDRCHDEGLFFEESADIQGVFMAYLAGYQTIHILPKLIQQIYTEFNLPANLIGYPSLSERQNTTKKAQIMSTELIRMYEAGNYLLAIGKYDLAISCFEYVENWYKGREVYNNLGICFTLLAINFTDKNTFPFLLPLEISWSSRIKKEMASRGGRDISKAEEKLKNLYLKKAENHFTIAAKMNPRFIMPDINMMCIFILKGDYAQAIDFHKQQQLSKRVRLKTTKPSTRQKMRLALALAYVHNAEKDKALRIWNDIKNKGSDFVAFQADFNIKTQQGEKFKLEETSKCPDVLGTQKLIDGIKVHRPQQLGNESMVQTSQHLQFLILEKPHSLTYIFKKDNTLFSLQRVFEPLPLISPHLFSSESIFTNEGYITHCKEKKLAFLLSTQGKLREWVKYF